MADEYKSPGYLDYPVVIDYIKRNLGYPVATIELSDNDIEHIIKNISLPYFSQYIPDVNQILVNKKVEGSINIFIIEDPDNAPIIDVVNVIQDSSTEIITMDSRIIAPIVPYYQAPDFVNQMTLGRIEQTYSIFWPSFTFIPPNLVRIYPSWNDDKYIVRYTRVHASLTTVPMHYARDFEDLCLSDVMMSLYSMRSKYSSYSTPYGEINLNADTLYQRATDLREKISERLKRRPPDTILYIR